MTRIEEIRERARKATKGEWVVEVHKADGWEGHYGVKSLSGITIVPADCSWDGFGHGATQNDADFIAHSNSDIEYLLSELDRLKAEGEGRLIEIPFKEGDTAYVISGWYSPRVVIPKAVISVNVISGTIRVNTADGLTYLYGKSAFKTYEEAAAKVEGK